MVGTDPAQENRAADVLVVDDEADARVLLRYLLESFGHRVTLAADGEEAVAATLAHDFDLILMDLRMPRMDGIDATRAILALAPEARIVACSAFVSREAEEDVGFVDTIAKPISPYTLRRRLACLVEPEPGSC